MMIEFQQNESGETFYINIEEWKQLGRGDSHIVLRHCHEEGENKLAEIGSKVLGMRCCQLVLIIKYGELTLPMHKQLYQIMQEVYCKIVKSSKQGDKANLSNFIHPTSSCKIKEGKHSKVMADYINKVCCLKKPLNQVVQVSVSRNLLDRSTYDWNFLVQFKIKTPLPDYYSYDLIQKVSQEMSISSQSIKKLILSSNIQQKTRHFKKQLTRQKQKKPNQNPFRIFDRYESKCDFLKTKGMKYFMHEDQHQFQNFPPLIWEKNFNLQIKQILHKSRLLDQILSLQMLYLQPVDFVPHKQYQVEQSQCVLDRSDLLQKTLEGYENHKCIDYFISVKEGKYDQVIFNNAHNDRKTQDLRIQNISKILRFLISLTWKDVSLVIRGKLNQTGYIVDHQVHIIDWSLKGIQKIQDNLNKDHKLLRQYIEYKLGHKTSQTTPKK